ncbi:hypothetical protein AX17_006063 [Amanita inopinata Kibby_2008]|nr:hypothetical protein AX17_006063 [Amanita inopinata Kibby_2008]
MTFLSLFSSSEKSLPTKPEEDLEKQVDLEGEEDEKEPVPETVAVASVAHSDAMNKLSTLEAKLAALLTGHIQEVKSIREGAATATATRRTATCETSSSGVDSGDQKQHVHLTAVDTHIKHLDEFFNAYVQNVRVLQERLAQEQTYLDEQGPDSEEHVHINAKTYESLLHQFNMQVVISTFSAGLIVAYCSLAQATLRASKHNQRLFNVGVLLSLFAIAFHAGNIVISGRSAALCSDHTVTKKHTLAYFHRALAACEQLYLHGTIFFVVAVFEMSFTMFDTVVYPAVFCGVSIVGVVLLVTGKYREVSVMWRNLVWMKAMVLTMSGRVGSQLAR